LLNKYSSKGLQILAFPSNQFGAQAPGSDECEREYAQYKFGAKFPVFDKILVNGEGSHPTYVFLKDPKYADYVGGYQMPMPFYAITWNYEKFLVNATGQPVNHYESGFDPMKMEDEIVKLLQQ